MIKAYLESLKNNRRKLVLTVVALLLVGFVMLIATLEITSQPKFCSSCHYMSQYYDQWKTSSHKNVPCLQCHAKPGVTNYLATKMSAIHEITSMMTGKSPPRPHVEISDASCLRSGCHDKRLVESKVVLKDGVTFDHGPHLKDLRRGRKLQCTTCHAQMAMGAHMSVTKEVCFLCHFRGRVDGINQMPDEFCAKCHKAIPEPITNKRTGGSFSHADYMKPGVKCQDCHMEAIRGDGNVPTVMCSRCHNNPKVLTHITDTAFMHENHVSNHKVECYLCHMEIKHSRYADTTSVHSAQVSCAQCHGGGHNAAEMLYNGKGGKLVQGTPASMKLAQVDCIGCHRSVKTKVEPFAPHMLSKPDASQCVACHDEDGATYLADWKSQLVTELAKVGAAMNKARGAAAASNDPEIKKLFADAEYDYNLVKVGNGVHNIDYSLSLLSSCLESFEKCSK